MIDVTDPPDAGRPADATADGEPADRRRALIGADLFDDYVRVLKLALSLAVPIVVALATVGAAIAPDPSVGDVVGAAFGAMFNAAVQVAFWVTLGFAVAERCHVDPRSAIRDLTGTVASAPTNDEPPGPGVGETVFEVVLTLLVGVAIVWQHAWPPLRHRGQGVPFLDPSIWDGPAQVFLAALAASLVVAVLVLRRRGWSYGLAIVNAGTNVASFSIVAVLAFDDRLVNPAFLQAVADRADLDRVPSVNPWLAVLLVAFIELWDTFDAFRQARRAKR